jgi:hypothetical protein
MNIKNLCVSIETANTSAFSAFRGRYTYSGKICEVRFGCLSFIFLTMVLNCDQKLASDSSGLSGGFRGIGRGFGL